MFNTVVLNLKNMCAHIKSCNYTQTMYSVKMYEQLYNVCQ